MRATCRMPKTPTADDSISIFDNNKKKGTKNSTSSITLPLLFGNTFNK